LLVRDEIVDLRHHRWRSPSRDPPLSPIDANSAMLARVIDLERHFAGRVSGSQVGFIHSYGA
jgi:hypothetical protein